jgi:hypothetical protein
MQDVEKEAARDKGSLFAQLLIFASVFREFRGFGRDGFDGSSSLVGEGTLVSSLGD